ncbi:MAG: hypothetical protein MMC23_004075 [Stictis urceolatum]|nr:hypothetical protein [Stictis urceolata]
MNVYIDLRINIDAAKEFDLASTDSSSFMSCPSLASSSSASRRDSVISSPYDPSLVLDFTEAASCLDIEGLQSLDEDDLETAVDDRAPGRPWCGELSPIYRLDLQPNEAQSSIEMNDFGPSLNDPALDYLSESMIGHMPMGVDSSGFNTMSVFALHNTVTPSVTYSNQHLSQGLSPSPQFPEPPDLYSTEDYDIQADDRTVFWSSEQLLCHSMSIARTPSQSPPCSPGVVRNRVSHARPHRSMQRQKQTRPRKGNNNVAVGYPLIPRQQIPCLLCGKKFQRPEHLTRHMKSAAHSSDCPHMCPVEDCRDKKQRRLRFNRKDNYVAHVVNCHLLESEKPRRKRIRDPVLIEHYGWTEFMQQKEREAQKRIKKQQETKMSKPCSRIQDGGTIAKRSSARQRPTQLPRQRQ